MSSLACIVKSGSNLKMRDLITPPDPYVKLSTAPGSPFSTSVKSNTVNPTWTSGNTHTFHPYDVNLLVEVWDKDILSPDDLLGSATVDTGTIPPGANDMTINLDTQGSVVINFSYF